MDLNEFSGTTREEWTRIFTDPKVRQGLVLPPEPPHVTPYVRHPTCPEHCRKHAIEARVLCRDCHGVAYHIVAHEWIYDSGHFWYTVEPQNGAPPHDPTRTPECCGQPMRRV